MTKRKRYLAEFKAKAALESIREELTTAKLAKETPDGVRMRSDTGCIEQGRSQFRHGDIAILGNDLREEPAVPVQLASPFQPPLWRRAGCSRPPDRKSPMRAGGRESFKRNVAARPLNPSSTNL